MSDLLTRAKEIKNATEIGENTAERVGGVMVDTIKSIPSAVGISEYDFSMSHEDENRLYAGAIIELKNSAGEVIAKDTMYGASDTYPGLMSMKKFKQVNAHEEAITKINADIVQMDDNILRHGEEIEDLQNEIATKQQELTLTVLDNGNIRIGNLQGQTKDFMPATPSGDPMHYAYEAIGAVYNSGADKVVDAPWKDMVDNEADKTVKHKSGCWLLSGIGDLTNQDMRKIYAITPWSAEVNGALAGSGVNKVRTTGRKNGMRNGVLGGFFLYGNSKIESLDLNIDNYGISAVGYDSYFPFLNNSASVKHVFGGKIKLTGTNASNFAGSNKLISILLVVNKNISLKDCSLLSAKSVLYMINNHKATTAITITLHHDCYNRVKNDADILAALAAQPLITLVDASAT